MLEVSFDNNSTGHCLQPTSQALGAKEKGSFVGFYNGAPAILNGNARGRRLSKKALSPNRKKPQVAKRKQRWELDILDCASTQLMST